MFEDFLREYIKELVEVNEDEYDIKEEDIIDIACMVNGNEYLWGCIDECIYNELDKYSKENY